MNDAGWSAVPWLLLPLVGLFCYQLGSLNLAVALLCHLPAEVRHRSWGLRILRHEGLFELEVGWIGTRLCYLIRRP